MIKDCVTYIYFLAQLTVGWSEERRETFRVLSRATPIAKQLKLRANLLAAILLTELLMNQHFFLLCRHGDATSQWHLLRGALAHKYELFVLFFPRCRHET